MIKVNNIRINHSYYPDNTLKIDYTGFLHNTACDYPIYITWLFENNEEQIILEYLVEHIRDNFKDSEIYLNMPYIPNARMDRIKDKKREVFTLKHFCKFINRLNFNQVVVKDAHSNVALGLLDRVFDCKINSEKIKNLAIKLDCQVMFYPDEGAMKRYSEEIKYPYIFGIKKRNWEDGKIVGLDVYGEVPKTTDGKFNAFIVDDICSKGGTFLHSAKSLKSLGANKIYLYITHCENTILSGELINSGLIEKIYTEKSIFTAEHPLVEVI